MMWHQKGGDPYAAEPCPHLQWLRGGPPLVVNQAERVRLIVGNANPNLVSSPFHVIRGGAFDKAGSTTSTWRCWLAGCRLLVGILTSKLPWFSREWELQFLLSLRGNPNPVPENYSLHCQPFRLEDIKGALVGMLKVRGKPRPDQEY